MIVAHAIAIFSCARLPLGALKKNRVFLGFESHMSEEPLRKQCQKFLVNDKKAKNDSEMLFWNEAKI